MLTQNLVCGTVLTLAFVGMGATLVVNHRAEERKNKDHPAHISVEKKNPLATQKPLTDTLGMKDKQNENKK